MNKAGFTWRQVFDGRGTKGPLVDLFNARGVPISYLIGADGRIAAKMVNGKQLDEQVNTVMGGGR